MKKFAVILLAGSLLSTAYASNVVDRVLATYKGGEVKESQVMEQYKQILDSQPNTKGKKFQDLDPSLQNQMTLGYLNSKLAEREGENSDFGSSKEIKDKLDNVKKQLVTQKLIEDYIKEQVTDSAINAEYDRRVAALKGQEEVKVSHILLDSEAKAKEVRNKINLKNGKGDLEKRFAAVAKEYSTDDGSKGLGGELGYILKGQLVPQFEDKAFAMKKGEVSEPVKTDFGWHVIMVSDKRPATIPDKAKETSKISADLSRIAVGKYFENLASKADVKIIPLVKDGAPAPTVGNKNTKPTAR